VIVVGLLLAGAVGGRLGPEFPWGTLVINVTGAFVLGLLTGLADHRGVPGAVLTVVGTGLLGAFTTFSTFAFDTVGLAERGRPGGAAANVGASLVLGLGAAALGLLAGVAL